MISKKTGLTLVVLTVLFASCKDKSNDANTNGTEPEPLVKWADTSYYKEPYRPQFHFSPEKMWMNDPNGMVYNDSIYHLFYQYYPEDILWGPMHWGHATSTDLLHWEHKPIALYPDVHGYIFSGSAVVDKENTSGFGSKGKPPLVAIFTYHDMKAEKEGRLNFQTQGIAYSADNGKTWKKYEGNPIIGNEGIKDFRDPKVIWHEESKSWVMTLVAGDHAQFYTSRNLKKWRLTGDFGKYKGAHGGVWECPDLFKLKVESTDEEKWVLLISINPGAPNGGSGTQYFVGDFDGEKFTTDQTDAKWIDWGTDNYAGVTYSNAPKGEQIFIGWMSNWQYATKTPTEQWRSAMTIPRKLRLRKNADRYELLNYPIENMESICTTEIEREILIASDQVEKIIFANFNQSEVRFRTASKKFRIRIGNLLKEEIVLTMNAAKKEFYLDRTNAGKSDFEAGFAGVQRMPVPNLPNGPYEVRLLLDHSSIEIFINEGQYVMTAQLFPKEKYTTLEIENTSKAGLQLNDFKVNRVQSVW